MSQRGRSNSRNNYNKTSAYPYRDNNFKFSEHDSREVVHHPTNRDSESGEHYRGQSNRRGNYGNRGRGYGNYNRGGYSRRRSGRNNYRGGGRRHGGGRFPRNETRGDRGDNAGSSRGAYIDDGDEDMEGGGSSRARPSPYDRPKEGRKQYMNNKHERQRPQGPQWSLITVARGAMLDQDWLLDSIQREAMVQVNPVGYCVDAENVSFCIEDESVANAIRNCNKKISTPDGVKLNIWRSNCSPPFTAEQIQLLKKVLSDRYNTETLHLNSSALFLDPTLRQGNIVFVTKNPRHLHILINIISEHIAGLTSLDLSENRLDNLLNLNALVRRTPRLKCLKLAKNLLRNTRELEHIKEWDLTELTLDKNPLCANFEDQKDYVSNIRSRFPNLMVLDGQKLPPPVKFDLEKVTKLVAPIPNHIPDSVTQIIKEFVKQYFSIYDTDREQLMAAYHSECMFSLTIPTRETRGAPLSRYFSLSRNLQRLKSQNARMSLIKTSQLSVCALLKELPQTEHDLPGFSVDVPLVSPTLIKFIIRGTFREKNSGRVKNTLIRAFTRAFLCITDGTRLSIVNEQLFIRNTTIAEAKTAFVKPPITPSPSPVHEVIAPTTVAPNRMEMVAAFVKESGMNAAFSEQCLNEHTWDYVKAGRAFVLLKDQGKIPPEAFVQ